MQMRVIFCGHSGPNDAKLWALAALRRIQKIGSNYRAFKRIGGRRSRVFAEFKRLVFEARKFSPPHRVA